MVVKKEDIERNKDVGDMIDMEDREDMENLKEEEDTIDGEFSNIKF